jgi:apolipoprotein N-acyltransferase
VLVNITHDGWFWGSSILDLQFACAVFRAVELRRSMLVAANAGISAVVDASGRIVSRGPRQGEATLVARIEDGGGESWYLVWGDLPAWLCLLASIGITLPFWPSSLTPFFRRNYTGR